MKIQTLTMARDQMRSATEILKTYLNNTGVDQEVIDATKLAYEALRKLDVILQEKKS